MDIDAAYLGEFGIPVGFVSGEDIAVQQALNALPWTKSVIVDKHKSVYTAGSMFSKNSGDPHIVIYFQMLFFGLIEKLPQKTLKQLFIWIHPFSSY